MPTDAVWIIITIPNQEYERELKKLKRQNTKNNFNNNTDDIISSIRKQKDLENSLEKILSETLNELQIEDAVWAPTSNGSYHQVYFSCELFENDAILGILKSRGIGTKPETSIGFIPFNLFWCDEGSDDEDDDTFDSNYSHPSERSGKRLNVSKKSPNVFKAATQEFLDSVTSRLTVAQVVEGVRSSAEITFDFTIYTLMAGFIAAFGLVCNDPVNIAASMMIEPVMTTVMAMTFGLVIEDKKLFWMGVKNNIISLLMCLIPGFIIGLIFFIWMTEWYPPPAGIWPTAQMQGRGTYFGIIYGIMIALPCGGAVAVSLLNSNYGALVGVAVASTFQPPFVNCGLLWALSTHIQIRGLRQEMVPFNITGQLYYMKPAWAPQDGYAPVYSYDMRIENALLGCVSMALTGVNVVCMIIVAVITLKIKEVMPLDKLESVNPGAKRFFTQDLRITREYNRKHSAPDFDEPIGKRILAEWAVCCIITMFNLIIPLLRKEIAGIDKNKFLGMSPEARITQLQTLYDIIKDVESDETYKLATKNAQGIGQGLARRLTKPIIHAFQDRNVEPIHNSALYTIEQELSQALRGRHYNVNPNDRSKIVDESNNSSPYSTVRSGVGITPTELIAERNRRKSSQFLGKSLRSSSRSPYSVWPGGRTQNRLDSFDIYGGVRHRTNYPAKFDPQMETTGF